jgi:hypothetical protein
MSKGCISDLSTGRPQTDLARGRQCLRIVSSKRRLSRNIRAAAQCADGSTLQALPPTRESWFATTDDFGSVRCMKMLRTASTGAPHHRVLFDVQRGLTREEERRDTASAITVEEVIPSKTLAVSDSMGMELLERDPTVHTDIDQTQIEKLPIESSPGPNQVVTLASPRRGRSNASSFRRRPCADAVLDRQ